jgi:type IV secretion system protein VirB9
MIRPALPPILIVAALAAAAPALAEDARLVDHFFNPDEVVRIQGQLGVQASVAFADDEHIENVAIGDSAKWQVTPNKRANLLFVKPLEAKARTNMTVVTDRRTYFFDLVAGQAMTPLYVLRLTYPEEPERAPAPGMTAEEAQAAAAPPAEAPVDPATLNFAWSHKGKAALLPARIYDDGTSTYLTWPAKTPIPAMQIKNEKGEEGPVNFAVRGDVVVVDGVPDLIVLRWGKDKAELHNEGPARPGPAPAALASAAPSSAAKGK